MASKGQSGVGQDQDDVVFVPYTTVMKKLRGITYIQQRHGVGGVGRRDDADVADRIATLLRVRHKIQPGDPDDFMVRTMEEMASVRKEATADDDGAARRASPACRCSSAASAS